MKDGVNPLRPSYIECTDPCDRGERHYDEFALAGRSAIAIAVVGLQRGSRYRRRAGLIAGSTARVRRTSASALTATMFSRDRGRLPTAGRAYRHSDDAVSSVAVLGPVTRSRD